MAFILSMNRASQNLSCIMRMRLCKKRDGGGEEGRRRRRGPARVFMWIHSTVYITVQYNTQYSLHYSTVQYTVQSTLQYSIIHSTANITGQPPHRNCPRPMYRPGQFPARTQTMDSSCGETRVYRVVLRLESIESCWDSVYRVREAITEEKQLICGHLPVGGGGGGGGLTNSVPFGVIFRFSTGTIFFL